MADQWFYRIGENEYGPVKSAELKVLAESEMISRATLVRRADDEQWVRAGKIAELFGESGSSVSRDPRARPRKTSSPRTAAANPSQPRRDSQPDKSRAEDKPKSATLPPRPKPARPRVQPETTAASAATARHSEDRMDAADEAAEYEEPIEAVASLDAEPEAFEPDAFEPDEFDPQAHEPAVQVAAPQFRQPAAASRSQRAPRRTKSSNQSKVIILASVAVVGCLLLFVGVFFAAKNLVGGSSADLALGGNASNSNSNDNKENNNEPPAPAIEPGEFEVPGQNTSNSSPAHLDLPDFIARYERATVEIDVITAEGAGNGSGFVVDSSGIVVTNHHVIEKARTAKCKFNAFHNYMTIDVEGVLFFDRSIDVAILKLKTSKTLPTLELAKQPPRKGEEVVAFGAPQGLGFTSSRGEVSAVRPAEEIGPQFKGYWVQTTAEITFGNSGGALVSTLSHKVVGINTFMSGDRAIRFASSSVNIIEALKSADTSNLVPLGSAEIAGILKWPKD